MREGRVRIKGFFKVNSTYEKLEIGGGRGNKEHNTAYLKKILP